MSINIQLTKGVTGGFIAATPKVSIYIDWSPPLLNITKYVKSDSDIAEDGYVLYKSPESLTAASCLTCEPILSAALQTIASLPTENPIAGQDIYGFDTSLSIESDKVRWVNRANEGCNIVPSSVTPTSEQRNRFKVSCL